MKVWKFESQSNYPEDGEENAVPKTKRKLYGYEYIGN